jgi:hypothetical protein
MGCNFFFLIYAHVKNLYDAVNGGEEIFRTNEREELLQVIRRQNILWDLIDAKMVEEETEAKPYKGRERLIQKLTYKQTKK